MALYIYILQCSNNKYYIGKTINPEYRINEHKKSNGSEWTKIYKPIKVVDILPKCDKYDEDKITMKYMDMYGIDNVRGGTFSKVNLDNVTINMLNKMKKGRDDICYNCGSSEHYINNCDKKYTKNNYNISDINKIYNPKKDTKGYRGMSYINITKIDPDFANFAVNKNVKYHSNIFKQCLKYIEEKIEDSEYEIEYEYDDDECDDDDKVDEINDIDNQIKEKYKDISKNISYINHAINCTVILSIILNITSISIIMICYV